MMTDHNEDTGGRVWGVTWPRGFPRSRVTRCLTVIIPPYLFLMGGVRVSNGCVRIMCIDLAHPYLFIGLSISYHSLNSF